MKDVVPFPAAADPPPPRPPARRVERGDGARRTAVRSLSSLALVLLACVVFAELEELRGALAHARFEQYRRAAYDAAQHRLLSPDAVTLALEESDAIFACSTMDPGAFYDIAYHCLLWSSEPGLNPMVRWRLIERAHESARLAARQAPGDYLPWLWLARAEKALGRSSQADRAWARAIDLAPPGMRFGAPAAEGGRP